MSNNDDNRKTDAAPRYQPCDADGNTGPNVGVKAWVRDEVETGVVINCLQDSDFDCEAEQRARRVAACLNYCADISTEQIELAVEVHRHRPGLSDPSICAQEAGDRPTQIPFDET